MVYLFPKFYENPLNFLSSTVHSILSVYRLLEDRSPATDSLGRQHLKTHLFRAKKSQRIVSVDYCALYKYSYWLTYLQTDKQTAVKTASPPKVVKAIDNMCTVCWQYHCGFSVKFARGFVYPWSKWRRRCNKFNYAGFLSGRLLAGVGLGLHVAGIRRRGLSTRLSISHQIFNALSA